MQISGCILFFVLSVVYCAQNHIDLEYKYGTEYQYEYTVGIVTQEKLIGAYDPSIVNYTCQFSMKFSNGTGFLKITQVEVKDNYKAIELDPKSNDFTNYYLKFDMLPDGKVSSLYPDSRETNWVLNFKRGLLSMFTSNQEDVHGICSTEITVTNQEDGDFWKKSKETFDCKKTSQPNSKFAVMWTMFKLKIYRDLAMNNWYYNNELFRNDKRGRQQCEGFVSDKVFQSINCTEVFKFYFGLGSKAFVYQQLTLLNSEAGATNFHNLDFKPVADPKNLMYEAEDTLAPLNSMPYFKISQSHLSNMCKNDFERSSVDLVQKYIELIQAFGALSYEQLDALGKASTCEFSKKMFLKSLLYTRSFNSTLLMMDKLIKKEVPDNIEKQWLEQLPLEEYINKPILNKAYELLQARGKETSFAFVVASIVNTYCQQYNTTCREDTKQFKSAFVDALKYDFEHYGEDSDSDNHLFIALKMVKTIAHLSESKIEILKTILEDQKIKPFVRASVLDVYPNATNFETDDLMKIFENPKEPIEVRAAVYINLFNREPRDFVPSIYKVLKEESPNQVTKYIWSHLRYHGGANEASNEEILKFIKCKYTNCTVVKDKVIEYSVTDLINELFICPELKVPDSLNTEDFSHYFQGDFSNRQKFSGSMIFTPDSFLPSHLDFKVQAKKYNDEQFEMFKLFADIEGFDDYFLSIFELEGRSLSKKLEEHKQRNRRNAKREFNDETRFSFGSEFFGKHQMYKFFHGDREFKELLSAINTLDKINVTMHGPDNNYNDASLVFDHVESLPTAAGFPVRYNLKAAFMRNLTISGKLESENFRKARQLHFNGLVEKFYGAGISRHLSVDTYLTESITKLVGVGMFKPKFHTKLDVEGFNHIHLDLRLLENEDIHFAHFRAEHYPGSAYNNTRERKQETKCQKIEEDGVKVQMCYPEDIVKNWFEIEYQDIPVTLKKLSEGENDPDFTIYWDKIDDDEYVLNTTTTEERVYFGVKDGHLYLEIQDVDVKKTDFLLHAKYENSENAKYIKLIEMDGRREIFSRFYKGTPIGSIVDSFFHW